MSLSLAKIRFGHAELSLGIAEIRLGLRFDSWLLGVGIGQVEVVTILMQISQDQDQYKINYPSFKQ